MNDTAKISDISGTYLISSEYQKQNIDCHNDDPKWGNGGMMWKDSVEAYLAAEGDVKTVIDYGCGKGAMSANLRVAGYDVTSYDPGIEQFSKRPDKADYLICLDVIEHIEPDYLAPVLYHISSLAPKCFLVISTRPAKQTLPDGRNAHLIVEDDNWWLEKLSVYFDTIDIRPTFRKRELAVICS